MDRRPIRFRTACRQPMPRARGLARGGFTLVELLVVITILALLLGMAALNFGRFVQTADEAATKSRLDGLRSYLIQYRTQMGDYPSSRLADHGVRSGNDLNEGIEALVVALRHKDYAYAGPEEAWLENMDGDKGEPKVTAFAVADLFEVLDTWGNPIVYMRYDDYGRDQRYEFVNQDTMATEDIVVKAAVSSKTGSHHGKRSFQLRSAGPDGVLGTDDDLLLSDD